MFDSSDRSSEFGETPRMGPCVFCIMIEASVQVDEIIFYANRSFAPFRGIPQKKRPSCLLVNPMRTYSAKVFTHCQHKRMSLFAGHRCRSEYHTLVCPKVNLIART